MCCWVQQWQTSYCSGVDFWRDTAFSLSAIKLFKTAAARFSLISGSRTHFKTCSTLPVITRDERVRTHTSERLWNGSFWWLDIFLIKGNDFGLSVCLSFIIQLIERKIKSQLSWLFNNFRNFPTKHDTFAALGCLNNRTECFSYLTLKVHLSACWLFSTVVFWT